MKNIKIQSDWDKIQRQKTGLELKETISFQDKTGRWHNNIPTYKEHIVNKIRDWCNESGNEIAKKARDGGWFSITNTIGYNNYTIPDRPNKSLVGYLNYALQKQYCLLYDIIHAESHDDFGIGAWCRSHEFRDQCFKMGIVTVIYKNEHLDLIKSQSLPNIVNET